ncbi:MAG: hypothetical protein CML80_01895 [Rhodobiaceae bacterium]|nr:hypothetical protein [Rhodobiaceae bacterium]OUT93847.1 MAG: hypothetical protein CBB89_02390 [Rhizobiales bacterium TMED29]|tara:strand:+ start:688 stop:942 length:255 start_codon:yes stop_codon:yes gene_type:complete
MYGRVISFTLLAPSLWSILDIAAKANTTDFSRQIFKSGDNVGYVIEVFSSKDQAGKNIELLKSLQGLKEQGMAKVQVTEGEEVT